MKRYSPLISGISVTNFIQGDDGKVEIGTLGFFATIPDEKEPDNVVLVSNQHVLGANKAGSKATIYQPGFKEEGGKVVVIAEQDKRGPVAKLYKSGKEGPHPYTYPGPGQSELDYFIDCAMAQLDICVSSWCDTNCGISYQNEIRALNLKDTADPDPDAKSSRVADIEQATFNETVFKVGRTTGKTEGRVTKLLTTIVDDDTGDVQENVMEITVQGVDCDGIARFSTSGDSGAALVNEDRKIVGIHYAHDTSNQSIGYSCHIHPALHFLNVEPITEVNPPVPPAGTARSDIEGFLADGINETGRLRERFLSTPRGAEIDARVAAHREEVVGLVNHRRPVTVAWHRGQGPAFLGHIIENARNPAHRIPFEIEGVDRTALIERMADVLSAHGSRELAAAIAAHRAEFLALIDQFDDLHEFVGRFEEETPVDA